MSRYVLFFLSVLLTLAYVESLGCHKNQHCSICGHYKEPECYQHIDGPNFIQCFNRFRPGCRCDKGFVRNPHSKECVTKADCLASSLRGWSNNVLESINERII